MKLADLEHVEKVCFNEEELDVILASLVFSQNNKDDYDRWLIEQGHLETKKRSDKKLESLRLKIQSHYNNID